MQVKDFTSLIEKYAPLSLQESYDNSGLICGHPDNEVSSILLSTDITEEVVEEAVSGGHNLIISHHPLTLQGVKNIVPDHYVKRCLIKAVKHDINLYAAHTNMDAVANGVSGRMADKLQLIHREILQPAGKLYSLTFYTPIAATAITAIARSIQTEQGRFWQTPMHIRLWEKPENCTRKQKCGQKSLCRNTFCKPVSGLLYRLIPTKNLYGMPSA